MNLFSVYSQEIPSFLIPYMESEAMQRLKGIDMNCGMNFTSFPLFRDIQPYSRYDHSVGVALIIWNFTKDRIQTLAGLFHDISTPAFSHTVDFMKGDYMTQEANENETFSFIQNDPAVMRQLSEDHISPDKISDYHIYPIADNKSPRLSADRLEYICGDVMDYHLGSRQDISVLFQDLTVLKNEEGDREIGFLHAECAARFAMYGLQCGKIYSSREDRYAMERLSDLLKECMKDGTLQENDLYESEISVIGKIRSSEHDREWDRFAALSEVDAFPKYTDGARIIKVKKRYIDPLVLDQGRVHDVFPDVRKKMNEFKNEDMNEWLKGDTF